MAYEFYVTVNGTKQGAFKGESLSNKHKGKLTGLGFNYEVKAPRDVASGQASGKRQHQPVTFIKEWGAASPQLFQALVTNEVLKSVLFEFFAADAAGKEEVFYTIRLTNASVSNIRKYIDLPNISGNDFLELEAISFTFQKIEIESKTGKTMATDDWLQGK